MRKIFILLFALVALSAGAQTRASLGSQHSITRAQLPHRQFNLDPSRAISNIAIDYDSADAKYAALNGHDMILQSWRLNERYPSDSAATLRLAMQRYDTLVDVNNNFAATAKAGTTVRVDSFDIVLRHRNVSTTNDTIIILVFDETAVTSTGSGTTQWLTTPPVWADTFVTNTSITPTNQFQPFRFAPNVTLPAGHSFGIRVIYRGPVSDRFEIIASFRDACAGQNFADTNKTAPLNSSYYYVETGFDGIYNYTSPDVVAAGACPFYLIQNFYFFPYVTLNTGGGVTQATVVTTAATGVTSTTATLNGTVNANGSSTAVTFEYGLNTSYGQTATATPSPVTGSVVTAVSANISGLTANTLYHFRVKGVNGGGTANGSDMTFTTSAAGTVCNADPNTTTFGPTSDNVPCIQQGVSFSQTYTFVVPQLATSVRIDSVVNLPSGLTAQASKNPPLYTSNERGCLLVTGTTNAPCGQYQMLIYVTIVSPLGTQQGELAALGGSFGFTKAWLRVVGNGGTCPAVDANQSTIFAAGSCGIVSITATAVATTNVNCFGGATGSATVTATGGSNYSYLWNNGQTNATASGLIAGTYTVTVTSGNATATATVTVTQPASALTATATATTTTCGATTGSATVTPLGGTAGYTYLWNNGQTNAMATNLGAGNYSVVVTDTKGCTANASTAVTTPNGPSATAVATNVTCFGLNNGSVDATVTGGTAPLSYAWSNTNQTTVDINGLSPNTYTLTVTDNAGCSFSVAATVTGPSAALVVTATTTPNTGGNNGGVNTTVTGGTGTYTYAWSNSTSTADLTNVAPGPYTVTVTDQAGCTTTGTYTVANSVGINSIELVNKFSVFPNPASTMVNVQVSFTETTDTKVELMDLTGKVVMTENTGKTNMLNYVVNVSAVPAGIYAIRVSGAKFNVVKQLTITK